MGFDDISRNSTKAIINIFGTSVVYGYSPENYTSEIKGVFDNSYIEVNGVSSLYPTLTVDLSTLDRRPSVKDSLSIADQTYKVIDVRSDSFNGAMLILKK